MIEMNDRQPPLEENEEEEEADFGASDCDRVESGFERIFGVRASWNLERGPDRVYLGSEDITDFFSSSDLIRWKSSELNYVIRQVLEF